MAVWSALVWAYNFLSGNKPAPPTAGAAKCPLSTKAEPAEEVELVTKKTD
jgi:hypothetical protein